MNCSIDGFIACHSSDADPRIVVDIEEVDAEDNIVYWICIIVKAQRQCAAFSQREQLQKRDLCLIQYCEVGILPLFYPQLRQCMN